jgi:glutamate carboxypeptidase
MDPLIAAGAAEIGQRAERELEALVAISSPSGDLAGAEEAAALCAALLPPQAQVERVPCSTPGSAPDLLALIPGEGSPRMLLLGHLDTVVAHNGHIPLQRVEDRLYGTGTIDMKGGVVLALGVAGELARYPEKFSELAVLLVTDEEWRTAEFAHLARFVGYQVCLCFEAGERGPGGEEGVVVRRKAAGTLRVHAAGRAAHSGSAPDAGRNALLALSHAATTLATHHDPRGPERLSVVPTLLRAGEALNMVPPKGELVLDMRAERLEAFDRVLASVPEEVDGVLLTGSMDRHWPGMDSEGSTAALLERASESLGRTIVGVARGGASDASHFAPLIPLTVDGLGPRGGGAHTPEEFVLADTLHQRAEVALAVAHEALGAVMLGG